MKAEGLYAATGNGLYVLVDGGAIRTPASFKGEMVSTTRAGPDKTPSAFVLATGIDESGRKMISARRVLLHLAIDGKNDQHLALAAQTNDVLENSDGRKSWRPSSKSSD